MTAPGLNLAVTKDGDMYNKLQRPADYLMSSMSHLPPLPSPVLPATYSNKRKRAQDVVPRRKRTRMDAVPGLLDEGLDRLRVLGRVGECGMRTTLPGLDEDEQLSDDSMREAIAYLRSVRSEASLIPTLLVAPTDEGHGDRDDGEYTPQAPISGSRRVIYKEGVSIAVNEDDRAAYDEGDWSNDDDYLDSQKSCYKLLLTRFRTMRKDLVLAHTRYSEDTSVVGPSDHSIAKQQRSKHTWTRVIVQECPTVDKIIQMDKGSVYLALQCCAASLGQSTVVSRGMSSWIWTLLALIGDMGTMNHEQIGKIRDLGVQAGRMGIRLRQDGLRHEQNGGADVTLPDTKDSKQEDVGVQGRECGGIESREVIADQGLVDVAGIRLHREAVEVDHHLPEPVQGLRYEDFAGLGKSGSEADMSTSGNKAGTTNELEQARAHLLAQLGDRLVQPGMPLPTGASISPRAQRGCPTSRAEAERLRQQTHDQAPRRETLQHVSSVFGDKTPPIIGAKGLAWSDIDWNTRITVDMILTVVAECYGQRDLLQFRNAWSKQHKQAETHL